MERPGPGGAIAAAAQGLAVEGDEIGGLAPQRRRPGHEAGLEQRRLDAIEHDAQPALLRHAEEILGIAAQERQMMLAPERDLVIVVTAGDRRAGHQEQHLAQRKLDLRRLPRIADIAEVVQQQAQAVLDENLLHGVRLPFVNPTPHESCRRNPRQQNLSLAR